MYIVYLLCVINVGTNEHIYICVFDINNTWINIEYYKKPPAQLKRISRIPIHDTNKHDGIYIFFSLYYVVSRKP